MFLPTNSVNVSQEAATRPIALVVQAALSPVHGGLGLVRLWQLIVVVGAGRAVFLNVRPMADAVRRLVRKDYRTTLRPKAKKNLVPIGDQVVARGTIPVSRTRCTIIRMRRQPDESCLASMWSWRSDRRTQKRDHLRIVADFTS